MQIKNAFLKGIMSDIDNSLKKPDQWEFPTLNARVINRKGQGFVITNMPGNEEEFVVGSPDNVVIGSCEFNGILYILSLNESTQQGELGSFPRPKAYDDPNESGFVRKYAPFMNYDLGDDDISPLKASEFNLSTKYPASLFGEFSYDGSVDIYIADHYNPNRVINSNFDSTGKLLERYYTPESFDGAINFLPHSKKIISIEFDELEKGGNLKPGNYFLFFRYANSNFNVTNFIEEFGPIPIFQNETRNNISGMQEMDWVENTQNYTTKSIVLSLKNLDPTFRYLQVGILRMSALTENASAAKDVYLIAKNFDIRSNGEMSLEITGYEETTVLTFEELITPKFPYNINKDHVSVNNVYYGINWKKSEKVFDREKFAEFAQKITISHTHSPELTDNYITAKQFQDESYGSDFFKKAENTLKYAGYLHGQLYAFGVYALFSDGSVSEVYPVQGHIGARTNNKGLFRFPRWREEPFDANGYTNSLKTLGVKFNIDTALSSIDGDNSFSDIIAIRFVRTERFDNFICQGIGMIAFDGVNLPRDPVGTAGNNEIGFGVENSYVQSQNLKVPIYKGFFPLHYRKDEDSAYLSTVWNSGFTPLVGYDGFYKGKVIDYDRNGASWTPHMALFSSDIMLSNYININEEVWVEGIARVTMTEDQEILPLDTYVIPAVIIGEEEPVEVSGSMKPLMTYYYKEPEKVKAHLVENHVERGPGNYSSYLDQTGVYWRITDKEVYNSRSLDILRYIGLTKMNETSWNDGVDGTYMYYYNIYKRNPEDFEDSIMQSFDPSLATYELISETIPIDTGESEVECFKGDTFLQKTYYRTHRWFGYQGANTDSEPGQRPTGDGAEFVDDAGISYQHGLMLGIFSENLINADMRNEVKVSNSGDEINYSFFPKCLSEYTTIMDWVVLRDIDNALAEALQVNDGYNQTVSGKRIIGHDENIPDVAEEKRPFRIYHADKKNPGAIIDAYRSIGISNYIDVDASFGLLMAIFEMNDNLFTVQENAVNQHILKERVTESDNTGNIVLANSTDLLPDFYKRLSDFGSQHRTSIVRGDRAVYGVDWRRNIIWMLSVSSGQTDTSQKANYFKVTDLTQEKFIRSWFDEMKEPLTTVHDITSDLADDPINSEGIVSGYNSFDDHVYITFLLGNPLPRPAEHKTIIINDLLQAIVGEAPFIQYHYVSLRDDFYSFAREDKMIGRKHNSFSNMQRFNGVAYPFKLSFVVNGVSQEQTFADLEKIFLALRIEMPYIKPSKIIYETEGQISEYAFSENSEQYWKDSEYIENEWKVPIFVQTSTITKQYKENSDVRGHWVKITIEYEADDPQEIYIKKVITDFINSEN